MSDDRSGTRRPRTLFDRIVVVDWSASSVPKQGADSIWIAATTVDGSSESTTSNPTTRTAAIGAINEMLDGAAGSTLVGIDASLGFPEGVAGALGAAGWSDVWRLLEDEIEDDDRNRNNRFEVAADLNRRLGDDAGPFWGRPSSFTDPDLTARKPRQDRFPTWRRVEIELRAAGWRPFSIWQLLGAGSVGSQSLLAIAALERLRVELGARCHVWPFTTGLTVPELATGSVVIAEVWPSLFERSDTAGSVRDERQVRSTAGALADLDRAGHLDRLFAPPVRSDDRAAIVDEEGWMLWPR